MPPKLPPQDEAWRAIFAAYKIDQHDFETAPFYLSAKEIASVTQNFDQTNQREPRLLCKQDSRADQPALFKKLGLFVLPVKNGHYALIKGEGYVDIPPIEGLNTYSSKLNFPLVTATAGNSEMQHLDFAYATSLIRSFMDDPSLVLTIRGRKYTPKFTFRVGQQTIVAESVQTEVDAGYEGQEQVVLVEAKNTKLDNILIRQLYYPFRQWQGVLKAKQVDKPVFTVFFEKAGDEYHLWQFKFEDERDYNSIKLVRSQKFRIT